MNTKDKIKKYEFYEEVLHVNVLVEVGKVLSDDRRDAEMVVEEKKTKDGTEVRYVIKLTNKKQFYSLVHESLHLVRHVFVDRDIPFNKYNHETIAYYQEAIVKKIWRLINK